MLVSIFGIMVLVLIMSAGAAEPTATQKSSS
jgi:hypothetical protein